MHERPDLRGISAAGIVAFGRDLGLGEREALRVFAWAHRPGTRDFAVGGTLGKAIRALLVDHARLGSLDLARVERSRDGTVKLAFRLDDGVVIESVLIPSAGRHTLCVSSQAGCAMGCRFCRTAALGFRRNLTPAEIVGQVAAAREYLLRAGLVRQTPRQLIDNLVFMGMGEPLANYENLVAALSILMDERAYAFSERRVTVSTCGLVPGIRALGRDARVNLAVSLHAADDETRGAMMPVNRTWGVEALLAACREYPLAGRRVVFVECVLISGLNDSERHARGLAARLRGVPCRVNLLPYNASADLPYRPSTPERVAAFRDVLHVAGLRVLVRQSRGADIAAACGQLAGVLAASPAAPEELAGAGGSGFTVAGPRAIESVHGNGRP